MRARFFLGWTLLLLIGGSLCAADKDNAASHYRTAFTLLPELTEPETDRLDRLLGVPLDKTSLDMLKRSQPALEELRCGVRLARCDWEFDRTTKGWEQDERKVVQGAARLAQLGCLKVRHLFEQKQPAAAVQQLADVIVLARHLGTGGSLVMAVRVESMALDVVAAYFPQKAETLTALDERLGTLPKVASPSTAMLQERDFVLHWIRPQFASKKTTEELRALLEDWVFEEKAKAILAAARDSVPGMLKLIDDQADRCAELAKIADLPPAQFAKGLAAFQKKYPLPNPLYVPTPLDPDMVSDLEDLRYAAARSEARVAMLRAAIVLQRDGTDNFKAIKDPSGDGPFEYEARKGGFELRSADHHRFEGYPPVTLAVGPPTKE
jgi:hypothetical protein